MCIYSLSVPNNSCKRSLRAIGTPSPGAAPLFSASSRCPGSPNHIPIVASFSDSLGYLGWPLWCLRKGVSWSCIQHHLVQSHTPIKDQEDSHGRTLGCCFLVLISLRHACTPLLPGNPSKWESKKKVIINRARKSHLLAFQCNFWSQQNVGSLERWCCIPNCGVSLVRKRTGKGGATWAMLFDHFRTPTSINYGTHQLLPSFLNLWRKFSFHPGGGSHMIYLMKRQKGREEKHVGTAGPKVRSYFCASRLLKLRFSV